MKYIKCHLCGKEFEHVASGSYPTGPCPALCPKCASDCCPMCGGSLVKNTGCEDEDKYTHGGCCDCDYRCCGGCI